MIISHKYRFIFIKTAKTAGTSIEVFLSQICGTKDIVTPIFPPEPGHNPRNYKKFFNPWNEFLYLPFKDKPQTLKDFAKKRAFYNHIPSYKIKYRISRSIWNSYYKFCVERNPWDKCVSYYNMLKQRSKFDGSFDSYIRNGRLPFNYPYYMDKNFEEIIVDNVISYEYLNEGLKMVFDKLNIPFKGNLGVNAKAYRSGNSKIHRRELTEAQIERIRILFEKEIKMHNYKLSSNEINMGKVL